MKRVLLFSGGLDSLCLWFWLGKPLPYYAEIGHRYEERELETISRLEQVLPLNVQRGGRLFLGDVEAADAHIPLRNQMLLEVGALDTGADEINLGALRGESSPDKSGIFFRRMTALLSSQMGKRVRVLAPARHLTKTALVRHTLARFPGVRPLLGLTRSCYAPDLPEGVVGCGACMACFRRWVALSLNGMEESYLSSPWEWDFLQRKNAGGWWRYMRQAPPAEWAGILENNLLALKAMQQKEVRHA